MTTIITTPEYVQVGDVLPGTGLRVDEVLMLDRVCLVAVRRFPSESFDNTVAEVLEVHRGTPMTVTKDDLSIAYRELRLSDG